MPYILKIFTKEAFRHSIKSIVWYAVSYISFRKVMIALGSVVIAKCRWRFFSTGLQESQQVECVCVLESRTLRNSSEMSKWVSADDERSSHAKKESLFKLARSQHEQVRWEQSADLYFQASWSQKLSHPTRRFSEKNNSGDDDDASRTLQRTSKKKKETQRKNEGDFWGIGIFGQN